MKKKSVNQALGNVVQRISQMKYRWADEKKYESFESYQKVIKSLLSNEGKITVPKSFRIGFNYDGKTYQY